MVRLNVGGKFEAAKNFGKFQFLMVRLKGHYSFDLHYL